MVAEMPGARLDDSGTVPETDGVTKPVDEFDAPEAVAGFVTFPVVTGSAVPVDGAVPPRLKLEVILGEFENGP